MQTLKRMLCAALCAVLLASCAAYAEEQPAPACDTFAYGCFGYRLPFIESTSCSEDGVTVHTGRFNTFFVTARRLPQSVQSAEEAAAAAQEQLGLEALSMEQGEDGVFRALTEQEYFYYRVYLHGDVLLSISTTNPQQLLLLDRHLILLDDERSCEQPEEAPELDIPEYLPFGVTEGDLGFTLPQMQAAMDMIPVLQGTNSLWAAAHRVDETHDSVVAFDQSLRSRLTFVYERESKALVSVQWQSLIDGKMSNADIYTAAQTAGSTAMGLLMYMGLVDEDLDWAAFGAQAESVYVPAQLALLSWTDYVSTEALQLIGTFESDLELLGRSLQIRIVGDPANGHRVEICLRAGK
ncbi:MAG: hypothetical protein Q4A66_09305 [Eubacteriales bacterium]|nr:hypothetical protein [Eubacteriales bacterium]